MQLSSNVDDMDPEAAAFALERLGSMAGVLDAWSSPSAMKKGRASAMTIHVLCRPGCEGEVTAGMFRETTTIGVRVQRVERAALERHVKAVTTKFGPIRVKVSRAVEAT